MIVGRKNEIKKLMSWLRSAIFLSVLVCLFTPAVLATLSASVDIRLFLWMGQLLP
jgi:hypothetical protein